VTAHLCQTLTEGCYRCELARDEVETDRKRLADILLPFIRQACNCITPARRDAEHRAECFTRKMADLAAERVMVEW
jgi:hypothetical protein